MNIDILARLVILVCAGIAILGLLIGFLVLQINRKKGLVSLLLGVIFAGVTIYYCYLFFFPVYTGSIRQEQISKAPFSVNPGRIIHQEQTPVMVILETGDGSQLTAEDGDYLEINSQTKVKITGASQNGKQLENIRINVIGFAPPNNPSSTDDRGYIFSYKDMLKRFAIDDEKTVFKAEVKRGEEKLAEVFLKFVK